MEWTEEQRKIERDLYNKATESFNKYDQVPWDKNPERFPEGFDYYEYFKKYEPSNLEFGDHFLFQILITNNDQLMMSYPKMGIFIRNDVWDQAISNVYIEPDRTWMYNVKYKTQPDNEYERMIAVRQKELEEHIEWNDQMYIFGKWKSKPTWQQMKNKYHNTFWFYKTEQEKRIIRLNELV